MTALAFLAAALAAWLMVPPTSPGGVAPRLRPVRLLVVAAVPACVLIPRDWVALALVAVGAGAGALVLWRRRAAARAAESTAAHMAEACDLLAAELAAGRPTATALDEAAAAWPAIGPVAEVNRWGGDVPAAFREVSGTPGAGGLRLLAAAWVVSQRTGGSLAAATRRVADVVRREQATRRVVAGELASARATARLVAGLPVVALLMGSGAGADPWSFLLRTPWGLGCLAAGLAVGFLGLWWIELIAREVDR
jgi:tight adherence protein B